MAQNERRITRRDFLKTGIAAVPIAGLGLLARRSSTPTRCSTRQRSSLTL